MIHPAHKRHDTEASVAQRFAERVAKGIGTVQFLFIQTLVILAWIAMNATMLALQWDPYPFILLNLAFSTQAAYAAPLILLSQRRQEALDRARANHDHEASEENIQLTRNIHAAVCGHNKENTV